MNFCPSAIATAAVFSALIINDLINKNYTPIVLHFFGGIFVVLGMVALCQRVGDYAGWLLLLIPIFVILIGFFLEWYSKSTTTIVPNEPTPGPCFIPCPYCGYCNPCRCRRRRPCKVNTYSNSSSSYTDSTGTSGSTGATDSNGNQVSTDTPIIGADLPPNPQITTLGKKNC